MGAGNHSSSTPSVSLQFPATYRYLALARATTREVCERLRMAAFPTAQLEMAVDEACTNIIEHGYGGACPADQESKHPGLALRFFEAPDQVIVEIRDFGSGFDPEGADALTPEEYLATHNERGLGLYIIRTFVDRMEYARSPDTGNTLRLTKRL